MTKTKTSSIYGFLLALILSPLLISCSNSKAELDFKDGKDALNYYSGYLEHIKGEKTSNSKSFVKEIQQWKQITDTVYKFIKADSLLSQDVAINERLFSIHDSIRSEMLRLTETWKCSYQDVISIKEATTPYRNDDDIKKAVTEAEPFFLSLDTINIGKINTKKALAKYRFLLKITKENGINSIDELKSYLRQEDIAFRCFLQNINDLDGESLSDITKDTDKICKSIFEASRIGKIPSKEVMIYMSIRTIRRLLQNSLVCVEEIESNNVKDANQVNAYLWMIVQPFISIDDFTIATIADQDRKKFSELARQLPHSIKFAKSFNIDQRTLNTLLPQQLLKIYISSL